MVKVVENENDNNPDGPAASKRIKTNKIQQQTMFIVLIASVVVGVCLVLSIYFFKVISFNGKVITAKDKAVKSYQAAIVDSGACLSNVDSNKDGEISVKELNGCNPDAVDAKSVPGTLRYNVMVTMADNYDLETVARDETASICYNEDKKKYNFQALYDEVAVGKEVGGVYIESEEKAESERQRYLSLLKMCTSLRVISEAMPTAENDEALMASLNQIFIKSDWDPEGIAPSSGFVDFSSPTLTAIPVGLSVEATAHTTRTVLSNIENSIRPFNILTATITFAETEDGTDTIELNASAISYYTSATTVAETSKTIKAKGK